MVLHDYYLKLLEMRFPGISPSFLKHYPYLAIQRNLQILGAFSYLSKIQGKTRFLTYLSPSLRSLGQLLEGLDDRGLHSLNEVVKRIQEEGLAKEADS